MNDKMLAEELSNLYNTVNSMSYSGKKASEQIMIAYKKFKNITPLFCNKFNYDDKEEFNKIFLALDAKVNKKDLLDAKTIICSQLKWMINHWDKENLS